MRTWKTEIGSVSAAEFGTAWGLENRYAAPVVIFGTNAQLYAWSHRSDASWPCSYLDGYDDVCAQLDSNGDLVDLVVTHDGYVQDEADIPSDELTAWIDDNLAGTPFAHLACVAAAGSEA